MSRGVESEAYFAMIPEWILDHEDLSPVAVRLYGRLNRHADEKREATPSRTTLAKTLKCSVDTVDRATRELRKVGACHVFARFDERGDRTSNCYKLFVVPPSHCDEHHGFDVDCSSCLELRLGGRVDAAGWPQERGEGAALALGGGRDEAATGGRVDAGTGGRVDAAQKQSQFETEKESSSAPVVAADFDSSLDAFKDRPEIHTLVGLLAMLVERNTRKPIKPGKRWFDACRLLLDVDKRSTTEVERVMRWATNDNFWKSNILSFPKFREKFDTLLVQSESRGEADFKPDTFKGATYGGKI